MIRSYIYGLQDAENLENSKAYGKVQYAFAENTLSEEEGDIIRFAYMEPPYESIYASKKDNIAYLEFEVKDNLVASIATRIAKYE